MTPRKIKLEIERDPSLPPAPDRSILVIDDDENVSSLVKMLLELKGYRVRVVDSGADGLSIIGLVPGRYGSGESPLCPDLVILDFEMQGINGFEVLRQIREADHTRKLPVIILTGTHKDLEGAVRFDATFFLRKPFDNAHILEIVDKALEESARFAQSPWPKSAEPDPLPEPPPPIGSEPFKRKPSRSKDNSKPKGSLPVPRLPSSHRLKDEWLERNILRTPLSQDAEERPQAPKPRAEAPVKPQPPAANSLQAPPLAAPPPPAQEQFFQPPETEGLDINLRQLIMRSGGAAAEMLKDGEESLREDVEKDRLLAIVQGHSPLVKMVDEILAEGVGRGASDIHLEPQERILLVRMRVDGLLQSVFRLPAALSRKVAARLKIMANLDISERRLPQDGRLSFTGPNQKRVEVRVSTLPSLHGEKVVLRLLRHEASRLSIDQLGLGERERLCLQTVLKAPQGLVLATGPTGSGKTTTLYSLLNALNDATRNIVTVEDPVEYELAGVTQVAVNIETGLTFEKVLRAFLRQDPNVMLVGEMRDAETADIGLRAAITGHLVLSSLHTNSAPATIARLINMGVKPFMAAAAVRLIVAQRLLRLLCPACRRPGFLTPEEEAVLGSDERAGLGEVFTAVGCGRCGMTGYAGRQAIFEIMPLGSREMSQAVLSGQEDEIAAQARHEGMVTLRQAALRLMKEGRASPQEVFPVLLGR